jgi:hypothetical protein
MTDSYTSLYILVGGLVLFAGLMLLVYAAHQSAQLKIHVRHQSHDIDKLVNSIFCQA